MRADHFLIGWLFLSPPIRALYWWELLVEEVIKLQWWSQKRFSLLSLYLSIFPPCSMVIQCFLLCLPCSLGICFKWLNIGIHFRISSGCLCSHCTFEETTQVYLHLILQCRLFKNMIWSIETWSQHTVKNARRLNPNFCFFIWNRKINILFNVLFNIFSFSPIRADLLMVFELRPSSLGVCFSLQRNLILSFLQNSIENPYCLHCYWNIYAVWVFLLIAINSCHIC